jgi:hypothetical protein
MQMICQMFSMIIKHAVTSLRVTEGDEELTSGITLVLPLLEGGMTSLTWVTLPCLSFLKQARNS